tara:strand:- start:416 stop:595 length:180 start_codon:yes stop_codon:yes gene_type:complete
MPLKYQDMNNGEHFHADKNMTTKDFENLGVYEKSRMFRPRKRNKKHKTIFSEIKTIKEN